MSWWDCWRWWDSAWDGTIPWPMFLPMLWPIVLIGILAAVVVLIMRSGRTEMPSDRPRLRSLASALRAVRFTVKSTRSVRTSCLSPEL